MSWNSMDMNALRRYRLIQAGPAQSETESFSAKLIKEMIEKDVNKCCAYSVLRCSWAGWPAILIPAVLSMTLTPAWLKMLTLPLGSH